MRNPWPMFGVLAITALLCMSFSPSTVWRLVLFVLVVLAAWIILPMKYDDWIAGKINPYIQEYKEDHDAEKLKIGLDKWQRWAITKNSRSVMKINRFSLLMEQGRFEEARRVTEELKACAKTAVEKMNYHLVMTEYAEKIGDEQLAEEHRQLSDSLKANLGKKVESCGGPADAKESRKAFLLWLSFSFFLLAGGILCFAVRSDGAIKDLGAGAVVVSLFSLPVVLGWLIIWIVRAVKEKTR